ncbi:MAG: radical SAM protein [Bdellovibrionota bacterium]
MFKQSFDSYFLALRKSSATHRNPIKAIIELTYGCNMRCAHCFNPTHKVCSEELSTSEIIRILEELADHGCLWVGFTGGELFTRKDTFTILKKANDLGMVFSILTNATMITPELADQIRDISHYIVEVSIYGATEATYEKVTNVRHSFSKFVRGVELLKARGVQMSLNLIMMSLNLHEFESMREFAISRGIRHKVCTKIYPRADGHTGPLSCRLTSEQSFEIWKKIRGEGLRKNNASFIKESCSFSHALFDCGCGKSNVAIDPYGRMNLCVSIQHPQFNLKGSTVAKGWETLVKLVTDATPGKQYECQKCDLTQYCDRGVKDSWMEKRCFDSGCISHHRHEAELKKKFLEHAHSMEKHGYEK